jgi:hypothetical protein
MYDINTALNSLNLAHDVETEMNTLNEVLKQLE